MLILKFFCLLSLIIHELGLGVKRTLRINLQSWTKMLRKMHLVCLILEFTSLQSPAHSRYFSHRPAPPKKTMLRGDWNISPPDLTTLIREGWGEGTPQCLIHRVCPPCIRKCKILNTFVQDCRLKHFKLNLFLTSNISSLTGTEINCCKGP